MRNAKLEKLYNQAKELIESGDNPEKPKRIIRAINIESDRQQARLANVEPY